MNWNSEPGSLQVASGLQPGAAHQERDEHPDVVGASLDHLIGTWTDREAFEMNRALEDLSEIDKAMWK